MRLLISSAILFVSSLTAYSAKTEEPQEIRFCRPNNMVSALAYIGESQGYFAEQALSVKFETATNAKICQDLMLAGKVDVFHGCEAPFSYIAALAPEIRILAFAHLDPETALFVRSAADIPTPAHLRGRRVGYLPGTTSFFFLAGILERHGLQLSDVALTPMQAPTLSLALRGGSVDAIVIWEPWGSNGIRGLPGAKVFFEPEAYVCYATLFASRRFAEEHPRAAERLLRAELSAEHYLHHSAKAAQAELSKLVSIDQNYLRTHWDGYRFRIHLGNGGLERMAENFRWLQRTDKSFAERRLPDFRAFIAPQFLHAVAPERIEAGADR